MFEDIQFETVDPDPCANCDKPATLGRVYCSDRCADIAHLIRYRRATWSDGRYKDPLVEEAIEIRFALVLSGGYDRRARHLDPEVRAAVLASNSGLCCVCNEQGAVQVDHIDGPSADRSNLQGICDRCHRDKTRSRMTPISPDDIEALALRDEIMQRMIAPTPLRRCDDPEQWPKTWRKQTTRWWP